MFSLAYRTMDLPVTEGAEFVRKKLERDYNKLSQRTREILKDRYENIVNVLFVDKD